MKMGTWTTWNASRPTPPGATPWPRLRWCAPRSPTSGGCAPPSATAPRPTTSRRRPTCGPSARCTASRTARRRRRVTLVRDDADLEGLALGEGHTDRTAEGAVVADLLARLDPDRREAF